MDTLEGSMDDFDVAINTYRYLVLEDDPYEIIEDNMVAAFYIDVLDQYEYYEQEIAAKIIASQICISVFEEYEHYEKCADLLEYQKELNNGI